MKNLFFAIMALTMINFYSCEVESEEDTLLTKEEGLVRKDKGSECQVNLLPDLPSVINGCTTAKGIGANNAYFDLTISDTRLAGDYAAWCIDVDLNLKANECFSASVYSSYGELPVGAFENPDNFDLVNWILNQNIIGLESPSGGTYTFGDVQWAIWELIDDKNCVSCAFLGNDWNKGKGQEIVDLALANGEGFMPKAGDLLGVVLIPDNNRQPVFIPMPLECKPEEEECETAFAKGEASNTCFINNGFNRWGWSIGPIAEGVDMTYDIYAGAAKCDTSKGELVGTVDVSYVNGKVTVIYNIDEAYNVSETHTYAGTSIFPEKNGKLTVAPGQYKISENLSGDIYVIAHAVVCK